MTFWSNFLQVCSSFLDIGNKQQQQQQSLHTKIQKKMVQKRAAKT